MIFNIKDWRFIIILPHNALPSHVKIFMSILRIINLIDSTDLITINRQPVRPTGQVVTEITKTVSQFKV